MVSTRTLEDEIAEARRYANFPDEDDQLPDADHLNLVIDLLRRMRAQGWFPAPTITAMTNGVDLHWKDPGNYELLIGIVKPIGDTPVRASFYGDDGAGESPAGHRVEVKGSFTLLELLDRPLCFHSLIRMVAGPSFEHRGQREAEATDETIRQVCKRLGVTFCIGREDTLNFVKERDLQAHDLLVEHLMARSHRFSPDEDEDRQEINDRYHRSRRDLHRHLDSLYASLHQVPEGQPASGP